MSTQVIIKNKFVEHLNAMQAFYKVCQEGGNDYIQTEKFMDSMCVVEEQAPKLDPELSGKLKQYITDLDAYLDLVEEKFDDEDWGKYEEPKILQAFYTRAEDIKKLLG